jgi:hypothetical protein
MFLSAIAGCTKTRIRLTGTAPVPTHDLFYVRLRGLSSSQRSYIFQKTFCFFSCT